MVTLISQDVSEFALHVRAFLGLPIGQIRQYGPSASAVILPELKSQNVTFDNVQMPLVPACRSVCLASPKSTARVV
jgi:phosphoribosylglycinamide formyltransferase 2